MGAHVVIDINLHDPVKMFHRLSGSTLISLGVSGDLHYFSRAGYRVSRGVRRPDDDTGLAGYGFRRCQPADFF